MPYTIYEVDGEMFADEINQFNKLVPEWPELAPRHFTDGYWWLVHIEDKPIAMAGIVPMHPFTNYGYLKRCYVHPDHHGHGLQYRLIAIREFKARQLKWTHLVSECLDKNSFSAANFRKAGFKLCEPEQPWAKDSFYWVKELI